MIPVRQPHRYFSLLAAAGILVVAAILLLLHSGSSSLVTITHAATCNADGGPAIVTDKDEYLPGETTVIHGCGFINYDSQTLTLHVTEPDSNVFSDNVTVTGDTLQYSYVVPNQEGTYTAEILDGFTVVASTTFLDAYNVDPTWMTFVAEQGSNPASSQIATLTVPSNCTSSNGSITDNQSWLSTNPTGTYSSGLYQGYTLPITVSVTSSSLSIGTYSGTVTINPGGGSCSSNKTIAVTLWVIKPNPVLTTSCGLDIALVIDSSGSIDSTELASMKSAFNNFVSTFLPDTPTQMAVVEFDTNASVTAPFTTNVSTLNSAINGAASGGFTNYDDALYDARNLFPNRADKPDLIVFASDGDPNYWGGNSSNNTTSDGSTPPLTAMSHAISQANAAKTAGIRIITLGIGNDLNTSNLAAISSPGAVITSNFNQLATDLHDEAVQLCGGTVTAHKIIDIDGNTATTGDQYDAAGWTFTTNVNSPDSSTPGSGVTDNDGKINFAINLGNDLSATLGVTETTQSGYSFISANCKKNNNPVGTPSGTSVNSITLGNQDIVSCNFYNRPRRTSWSRRTSLTSLPTTPPPSLVTLSCTGTGTTVSPSGCRHCQRGQSPDVHRARLPGRPELHRHRVTGTQRLHFQRPVHSDNGRWPVHDNQYPQRRRLHRPQGLRAGQRRGLRHGGCHLHEWRIAHPRAARSPRPCRAPTRSPALTPAPPAQPLRAPLPPATPRTRPTAPASS